ncbi:hypothetical protein C2S52_019306 [Perilla frutescens var. hirtella]|nr:hypothetical protein C2S52_019306 [Perilla frutescens var. hirtella]
MYKHPKWALNLHHDATRFHPEDDGGNDESGGSSKGSRTSEDGEYYSSSQIPEAIETPSSSRSEIPRPTGRDKAKKKEKGKASQSTSTNEVAEEIRALRLTRESELEVMNKLGNARLDLEHQKLMRKSLKSKEILLNTLLAKEHLTPADEELKRRLMAIVFGD